MKRRYTDKTVQANKFTFPFTEVRVMQILKQQIHDSFNIRGNLENFTSKSFLVLKLENFTSKPFLVF